MKKRVFIVEFVFICAVVFLLILSGEPHAKGSVLLRMVTDWPAGARVELVKDVFVNKIVQETNGRVKIEIYPGSQLVKADDHPDAISSGMVEMAVTQLSEGWPSVVPELTILGISLFDNSAHAFRTLDGPLGKMLANSLERKVNTKLLNFTTAGDVDVMACKTKQLKEPNDLRGLKFRVSSKSDAASCKALGGTPVIIAGSEMYMALQRGTVDGIFVTSTRGVKMTKVYEVCKYYTRIPLVVGAQFGFVINLETWKALPKDIQNTLVRVAAEARKAMLKKLQEGVDKSWKENMGHYPGVKVYYVPENEIVQWKEKMLPARLKLLEKAVSKNKAQEMIDWLNNAR